VRTYLLALGAGLLVGVVYALLKVRSPAPPVIALVGLLGILGGEQIPPLVRGFFKSESTATAWLRTQVLPHMFGALPTCLVSPPKPDASDPTDASKRGAPLS
jgi:XapX domain-containing protein